MHSDQLILEGAFPSPLNQLELGLKWTAAGWPCMLEDSPSSPIAAALDLALLFVQLHRES